MKTILISISLLFLSILLVVGCEVIDKNLQEDSQLETEVIQQTSDIEEAPTLQNNTELTDFEDDNKGKLQKTDDS
ncbi:hypothetical protein [Rhodohalobacter sp.]|uniref:hypothetical protein n=1 Tax=Rhodohalobacter sp. TaxID=1974210 RepID=UPI002ACDD953|nr:hypothetical protein [Rhodohalobacter sp.]MDZ7757124.1 hypothetical protein [Rhodohalobacter sp.]